jgi:hypothetical protein
MSARTSNGRFSGRGFQYRLLIGNFLYIATVVLVFVFVLFAPVMSVLADESAPPGQRDLAAHQMLVLHERVWYALPVLIALCIVHAVFVSHRVARSLQREARRADDVIRRLRGLVGTVEQAYREASRTLPALMDSLGREGDGEAAVLAGKLGTQMDALGRGIRRLDGRDGDRTTPAPTASPEPSLERTRAG